jgi:hypothetical protein
MVDWMLGHPFSSADLSLNHAALKGDVALTAVGDDLFDTTSGASRQHMPSAAASINNCAPEVSAPHLWLGKSHDWGRH